MQEVILQEGIVKGLMTGDRKAVAAFVDQYSGFIYNVCHKVLLSRPEAEEATQDTMLKVLKAVGGFDVGSSFKAWCYTIAYRTAIDYQRRQRPTTDVEAVSALAWTGGSDDGILQAENRTAVTSLLRHLDEESRVIISLFYLEEKNIREIEEITGLTESNIKIKLFRARKELARHAPKYFEKV